MFLEALVINDPYIQTWDTTNVTNMVSMFSGANEFDQPIGSWNVKNVTNMTDMFLDGKLSKTNYDHLLNGWGSLTGLQSRVTLNAGSSIYSYKAAAAKNNLVNTYKWTIIDGGIEKNNPPVVYNFSYASISNGSVSIPLQGSDVNNDPIIYQGIFKNYEYGIGGSPDLIVKGYILNELTDSYIINGSKIGSHTYVNIENIKWIFYQITIQVLKEKDGFQKMLLKK
jgi:surface protein